MSISECRSCKSKDLAEVLNLGEMSFTGIFPISSFEPVPRGILRILVCNACSLGQLDRNFDAEEMYGDNYGYRSGLNNSMVAHLGNIVKLASNLSKLQDGDVVLDIGSNDGTLLSQYESKQIKRIGIDPTIKKFGGFYEDSIVKVPDFFSSETYFAIEKTKAKIVTSVAMFYDLPDPVAFSKDVASVLEKDGIWFLEFSYAPWMVETGAFDTVCHEHLEYYSLHAVKYVLKEANLKVIHLDLNDTNGGSLLLGVVHAENQMYETPSSFFDLLATEKESRVDTSIGWQSFQSLVDSRIGDFEVFLKNAQSKSMRVMALGASTKGNVLLQALGETASIIEKIGEVNEEKFGSRTPGTDIEITDENSVLESGSDYIVILPWHFRDTFERVTDTYLKNGGKVVYPLPKLEIKSSATS